MKFLARLRERLSRTNLDASSVPVHFERLEARTLMSGTLTDLAPVVAAQSVAADGAQNVYMAAAIRSGDGTGKLFVAKQDHDGDVLWEFSSKIKMSGLRANMALGGDGSVTILGTFTGSADFDPGPGTLTLRSQTKRTPFILRLDTDGNLVFARTFSSTDPVTVGEVAVDGAGNIYFCGTFEKTLDADPGAGTVNLVSRGGEGDFDAFVIKLDSNGDLVWSGTMGGNNDDDGLAIATDGAGVYVAGSFQKTADFDPGVGVSELTSQEGDDGFVVKLDAGNGSFVWADDLGGNGKDAASQLVVDPSGDVLAAGAFGKRIDIDPGVAVNEIQVKKKPGVFTVKLDGTDGTFVWGGNLGGTQGGKITLSDLATDAAGDMIVVGGFRKTIDFDSGPGTTRLIAHGTVEDAYIVKLLAADGALDWAAGLGGGGPDIAAGAATDTAGNVYSIGSVGNFVNDFDPGPGTADLSTIQGVFVSELDANGLFVLARLV